MTYEKLKEHILEYYFDNLLSYGQSCCSENGGESEPHT